MQQVWSTQRNLKEATMEYMFEDLVTKLNDAHSPFDLAEDMPIFQQGMTDLLDRLQALERSIHRPADPPK
jgi:hypothetical protein